MTIKNRVLSGLGWAAASRFLVQVISWGSTIFVIRLLEPRDYGLMAIAMAFVLFSELITQFGAGESLVRSKRATRTLSRQIHGLVILVNGTIFVILTLSSIPLAWFYEEPLLTQMIPLLSLRFLMSTFSIVPLAQLRRQLRFRLIASVDVIVRLGSILIVLITAIAGLGVWALVCGRLAQSALQAVSLRTLVPTRGAPLFDFAGTGGAIRFSGFTSLQQVLAFIYSESDKLIVGKLLSTQALGFYNVAMQLSALPLDKLGGILTSLAFPAFARLRAAPEKIGGYLVYAVRMLSVFGFPMFYGLSAVAPVAVPWVLGSRWLDVVLPMQILCAMMPLRLVAVSLAPPVNALGRPEAVAKVLALAAILFPAAFFFGVRFGVVGVALAWVIVMPIWFCAMAATAGRHTGSSLAMILSKMRTPFLAASIMWLAVTLTDRILDGLGLPTWVSMLILVIVGAATYGALMILIDPKIVKDLRSLRQPQA